MNKSELNREIVLSRPTVKKAKVRVIRKLIKKIKILRSCKNENSKEKKFRKARRLTAEIHEMKSLKPDYVMKFALLTENYVHAGSNTKLKRKRNACAKLAKHKEIVQKVNDIRGKFLNWQEVLPLMIQSVKKSKTSESKVENKVKATAFDSESSNKENNLEKLKELSSPQEEHKDVSALKKKIGKGSVNRVVKDYNRDLKNCEKAKDVANENHLIPQGRAELKKVKKNGENERNSFSKHLNGENAGECDQRDEESTMEKQIDVGATAKVDDPFFIGKKVAIPNLMKVAKENDIGNEKEYPVKNRGGNPTKEPRRSAKRNQMPENGCRDEFKEGNVENDLHPSWKAKKIQMIKPFEGRKIIFE